MRLKTLLAVLAICVLAFGIGLLRVTGSVVQTAAICGVIGGYLLAILFVFITSTLIHEAGHFLAGSLVGHRFYAVRIWALELARRSAGFKLSIIQNWRGAQGAMVMGPTTFDRLLARHRIFILGGPIASALESVAAWLALRTVGDPFDFNLSIGRMLLAQCVLWAGVFGAVSAATSLLWLGQIKGRFASDGRHLMLSVLKRRHYEFDVVLAMVAVPWHYGVRARDWNADAVKFLLANAPLERSVATAELIAYYWAADVELCEEAREHLERARAAADKVDEPTNPVVKEVYAEAAYAYAWFDKDPVRARELLEKSEMKTEDEYSTADRAMAAILLAEGKRMEANTAVDLAEKKLRAKYKEPFDDNIELELEFLTRLKS